MRLRWLCTPTIYSHLCLFLLFLRIKCIYTSMLQKCTHCWRSGGPELYLKMHLGPWTCFLLPFIPLSMDRLYTNSSVPNYNEYRYITDSLWICLIYGSPVHNWKRNLSFVAPLQLFSSFIKGFFYIFSDLDWGSDRGCHSYPASKAPTRQNNVCYLGL